MPDLNFCLVDAWPGAEQFMRDAVRRIRDRKLPAVIFASASFADAAAGIASGAGLEIAGTAPLMVCDGDFGDPATGFELVDANGSGELLAASTDLQSIAFGLDRAQLQDWMSPAAWPGDSTFRCYVAMRDGRPISTVAVSGPGPTAGIWSMATAPDQQRQGAGRAALLGAMSRARESGAESFYLMASEAGKRLYEQVGFRTVEEFPLYAVSAAG